MPTPLMKSLAQQSGRKPKTVENLWKKCEKIVKKEYEIDSKSERFYPLVVGCLKNMLDIKSVEEDADITTTTMGNYQYYPKIGDTQSRQISSEPSKVDSSIKKSKRLKKVLDGYSTAIDKRMKNESLDEILSVMINYYSDKFELSEDIIDKSIEMAGKYLNINISELDID